MPRQGSYPEQIHHSRDHSPRGSPQYVRQGQGSGGRMPAGRLPVSYLPSSKRRNLKIQRFKEKLNNMIINHQMFKYFENVVHYSFKAILLLAYSLSNVIKCKNH